MTPILIIGARQEKIFLPPPYETSSSRTIDKRKVLFNDLLTLCKVKGACFSRDGAPSKGKIFFDDLTKVLWEMDPHLAKMRTQGEFYKSGDVRYAFPDLFKGLAGYTDFDTKVRSTSKKAADYYGYNNWRSKKDGCPNFTVTNVDANLNTLADILGRPHINAQMVSG